jgi:hypothetical protein
MVTLAHVPLHVRRNTARGGVSLWMIVASYSGYRQRER